MNRVSVIPALPVSSNSDDALQWSFAPDLESEITTLAAWCQAHQQQREPLSFPIEGIGADLDDWTDDEECTDHLIPPTGDGDADVKKLFLDQLAELLCHKKDPALITSTALIYSEMEAIIVVARNSTPSGNPWSDRDVTMLEYLAELLERISADDIFECDPLPALQSTLSEYYSERIRYHARNVISLENGKTGLRFFKDGWCDGVVSGQLPAYKFVKAINAISDCVEFYTKLKANLAPHKLRRIVEEMAHIERPFRGASTFFHLAQQCPGFRKVRITLLGSLPARKVKKWPLPKEEFSAAPHVEQKFSHQVKKSKNVHAEMVLMAYLLGSRGLSSQIFPYLGVSKKTCLLCGHLLREMNFFETRGNHGKCYSQWTFPQALRTNPEVAERLQSAIQRLKDNLWDEATSRDVPFRNAEKESAMAVPIPPRYEKQQTIFNRVVEDPRVLARETEWLTMVRKRQKQANMTHGHDNNVPEPFHVQDDACGPEVDIGLCQRKSAESTVPKLCAFCQKACKLTHMCKKCRIAAHCSLDCYRSDWHRHKFSCSLGRPTDATDHLVLACHTNQYPLDDDVAEKYGIMYFASGHDRWRLFKLYRRLVVNWKIDEDELRSAIQQNKFKEMLTYRCLQTRDPEMLRDMQWLESEDGFRADGKGPGLVVMFQAAQRELLSPEERKMPIGQLQPPEKQQALVFYVQIRNGFIPGVAEDNWISLGFCTTTCHDSEKQLASAYESLIMLCSFNEFWNAMAESTVVELFRKYRLADRILHMRNFKDFMAIVKKWYQSVWELKRFIRMDVADPFRAVVVDYGFMNCEDAHQRMQLRKVYHEYFKTGEDEMRLHEACISGKLSTFFESVFGRLPVHRDLLWNHYPLENCPQMGMVIASVVVYTESVLGKEHGGEVADGTMIFVIPETEEEEMTRHIHDRAAFLGVGLRKRRFPGPDGKSLTQFAF
ncbi:hypothetical protein IQ07DRAFT_606215 [Pyrenochaeta sp. DS3sAY3a]|nr:hypothetical protein IQ07DRAFT_606215 [Pyrenochaeta sp. DS3sAY3a]